MTSRRPSPAPVVGAAALLLLASCASPPAEAGSSVSQSVVVDTTNATMTDAARPRPRRVIPRASRSRVRTAPVGHRAPRPRAGHTAGTRPVSLPTPDRGFTAWAHSRATYLVFRCESHWNPHAVSSSGKYRGLIQADAAFWATYGGLRYAPRPDEASALEQLLVAYRGWLARGWSPWSCARIVGVL